MAYLPSIVLFYMVSMCSERYRRLEQQLADERQAADELSATLEQSRVKCASVLQEAEVHTYI